MRKTVTFGKTDFDIAPLNSNQIDEIGIQEMLALDARSRTAFVISSGLNNAGLAMPWTPERCLEELSLPAMQFLDSEIRSLSGLAADTSTQ